MNKLKSNMFWVLIGLVLVVELAAYVVVVRGKANHNADRIGELDKRITDLKRMARTAARPEMIEAARNHKKDLQREYGRMVLYMIGKDDLLDHFGDNVTVAPADVLKLTDWQKTRLGRFHRVCRGEFIAEAEKLGMIPEGAKPPWDFVDLSGNPKPDVWIYAYKQLWIQKELMGLMKQPVSPRSGIPTENAAGQTHPPLVTAINSIKFELPQKDKNERQPGYKYEARFSYYRVTVEVSMPAANVPILMERILKHELPLIIESYKVAKALDEKGGAIGAGGKLQNLVSAELTCKIVDFTMGLSKAVFAGSRFQSPEAVIKWLEKEAKSDEMARILRDQIKKKGVKPRNTTFGIEYVVYPRDRKDSLFTSTMPAESEIYDGVTIYYGNILECIPDLRRRLGGIR